VLSAVYNPKHPQFFNAYMVGSPHKDLRYSSASGPAQFRNWIRQREVALINVDGGGMNDGIWYSEHLASELSSGKASSNEDKRLSPPSTTRSKPSSARTITFSAAPQLHSRRCSKANAF